MGVHENLYSVPDRSNYKRLIFVALVRPDLSVAELALLLSLHCLIELLIRGIEVSLESEGDSQKCEYGCHHSGILAVWKSQSFAAQLLHSVIIVKVFQELLNLPR